MKKRLYIDQNILGYLVEGKLSIDLNDFEIVFSDTHFKEIPNENSEAFCATLDKCKARMIKCNLDKNLEILNNGTLMYFTPTSPLYKSFHMNWDRNLESIWDGTLAFFFGSMNKKEIIKMKEVVKELYQKYFGDDEDNRSIIDRICTATEVIDQSLNILIPDLHNLEKQRKKINTDKGKLNAISNEDIISVINESIKERTGINLIALLMEQLNKKSLYEQVVGLHSFLNHIGYHPDEKLSKKEKISNMRYDGEHIGYSIYCNYLISEDRRMIMKANAIFNYLNIDTRTIKIEFENHAI